MKYMWQIVNVTLIKYNVKISQNLKSYIATDLCTRQEASLWPSLVQVNISFVFDHKIIWYFVWRRKQYKMCRPHFLLAFSEMLFPALSCIAVGGMLLLITNMQVNTNLYHWFLKVPRVTFYYKLHSLKILYIKLFWRFPCWKKTALGLSCIGSRQLT